MKTFITYFVLELVFILFSPLVIFPQSVGNYNATRSTSVTYKSIISTGQSIAGWRYTGAFSEDDNRSELTDIGFDFWYDGTRYTRFSVSTNGFIDFSNSTDNGGPNCDDYGYCNTNFTSPFVTNGTWNALAPFYDDMTTGNGIDPLGTSIKYQVSGITPNRSLTVEWDGMGVYQNITPDLNFQVVIYESTGVIEYNYETMNNGTHTFSHTIGINATSISATPTTSELLTQQTANTATFSNSTQNNLSVMPSANSRITFTPLTPTNSAGSLTINNIGCASMTLNWSDWASNEVGYVIYYSTDDINYFFSTQTAANTSSISITELLPGTTYYWRLYAVTEGTLSNSLTASATTLPPRLVTSVQTGRWDRTNTWDCACIPNSCDNVIIQDSHIVTLRSTNEVCNDLTIGQGNSGQLRLGRNNTTAYDLTINGNTIVNTGAIFQVRTNSNTTHTVNFNGNLTNNGTFDMQTDGDSFGLANFFKPDGNQTIDGSGATTNFYTINITKVLKSNILDITSSVFSCDVDALTIVDGGTFQFSSAGTNTFSLYNSLRDIPVKGSIVMNSDNGTMSFGAGMNLRGDLTVTAGIVNIGDTSDENIVSFGGKLSINGGSLNVAGRYDRNNSETISNFTLSAGTLTLPTSGSTSGTQAPFGIDVIGSTFNMSGGSIIIERAGGTSLGYINTGTSLGSVSGGVLQIGNVNTPTSQTIQINSSESIGSLFTNSTNATAQLISNDLNIITDVTLSSGVLDPNGQNITLNGDWTVAGGSHNATTGEVIFAGTAQSISSNGSVFNNITLSGSSIKTFQDDLFTNGNLTINATMQLANTGFNATIGGDWNNNGTFSRNDESILFNGTVDQNISGTSSTAFTNITINKSSGRLLVESTVNLAQTLDIQSATEFDADGAANNQIFSLLSSSTEESRVNTLPAGALVSGNLRAEKHLPIDGSKRWRFITSIVEGATIADLQNEIPISGNFTGSDNGIGGIPSSATGSLAYYDNTIGTAAQTLDDRWVLYPSTDNNALLTTTGSEGRGYTIWMRDLGAVTFDLTGTLNQGTIDYNPTGNNERWNLIANPYPSSIDWDAASGWTKSGIQGNAIHIWNGTQYLTWNGTLGSLGNGLIAKGQSYFIEGNNASMTLISSENVKTTTTATTHRDSEESPAYIELVLSDNTNEDKAFVQLLNDASTAMDIYDAGKLTNAIFNISTHSSDEKDLSINAIGGTDCNITIPINIYYIGIGNYNLSLNNLNSFPEFVNVQLIDEFTGEEYNLDSDYQLNFEVTSDQNSYGKNRFSIVLNSAEVDESLLTHGRQDCDNDYAHLTIENTQTGVDYLISVCPKTMNSHINSLF